MGRIHELRNNSYHGDAYAEVRATYQRAWEDFGYGSADITVHNYWDESPFLDVGNDLVKWIVLDDTARDRTLLVLQSYSPETSETTVDIGRQCTFTDIATGENTAAPDGRVTLTLPADCGTRVFLVK
jgi:hypothetical protein